MNQYCRYCAFCFEGDYFGCSNHPEGKQPYMTRKQINRKNNCPNFSLTDFGDVETGKPYRPLKVKNMVKHKVKQISMEEVLNNDSL